MPAPVQASTQAADGRVAEAADFGAGGHSGKSRREMDGETTASAAAPVLRSGLQGLDGRRATAPARPLAPKVAIFRTATAGMAF